MKIYILVSSGGHYEATYRSYEEARRAGVNKEILGFEVWEDTL